MTADVVALAASSQSDAVAWRNLDDDSELTLRAWDGDANRLARGLVTSGIRPGDRVMLAIGPTDPFPWLVTYVAIHRAGAVAVPVNTRLAPAEIDAIVAHAEPSLVVTVAGGGGGETGRLSSARASDWSALLHDDASPLAHETELPDPVDIMYTSGTTGAPKAVVARPGGSVAADTPARWNGLGFMTCSPFSTTSGILLVDGPLRGGMSGWYLPRFDPGRWLGLVEHNRPVVAFLVPAMAQLLVSHPGFGEADLTSLAAVTFGGAPMARSTLRRIAERLPAADVLVGYGMTEFGAVSRTPSGDGGRHLGSVGRPLPGVEIRVVDDDGRGVAPGQVGEVNVRGAGPAREYFKDPDNSERTWREGWLYTGDLGYLDLDGFLWITGRAKDVIIRGGHNIVPGDVEEVLLSHPAVVDAVVVGIPHPVLGEDVATWVVPREHSEVSADDLRSFMLERLADYKVPRAIHLVGGLPRNDAGKVVRGALPGLAPGELAPGGRDGSRGGTATELHP